MSALSRFLLCFMGLTATTWVAACGEIAEETGQSCSAGTQCIWPAVCCTNPRIPAFGAPIPLCEDVTYCDAFLPLLVDGNPCNRALGMLSTIDACADPWICCPQNLTCMTAETCATAEAPAPVASPSMSSCHADLDCPEGELCMGINMRSRNGTCMVVTPQPQPQP